MSRRDANAGSAAAWAAMVAVTEAQRADISRRAKDEGAEFDKTPCSKSLAMTLIAQERFTMLDLMKQMSARIHALEEQATRP